MYLYKLYNYKYKIIQLQVKNNTITSKIYISSYFLYNITHPTKHGVPQVDLSDDEEVRNAAQENLSGNQLLIERVICKTFTYHRCNVIITDRLRSLFTNKLLRMGKAMHKLGGRGRTTQIETWKGTTWTIDLKQNEIVHKSRKRKAENVLVQNQVKKIALLKEDLESCRQSLKDANKKIKEAEEANKRLSQKSF